MRSSDRETGARARLGAIVASSTANTGTRSDFGSRDITDHRAPFGDPDRAGDDDSGTGFDDYLYDEVVPAAAHESLLDRLRSARWEVGGRGTFALAVVGVSAAVVALMVAWNGRPVPEAVPPLPSVELIAPTLTAAVEPPPADLVVSVVGLVARPGLVHLEPGARVADALDAAGGSTAGADLLGLNLARKVADGDQIVVGAAPPEPAPFTSGIAEGAVGANATGAGEGEVLVDLNVAGESDLDALPGVGPVTAGAIVAWREAHGPFTSVEQLGEVDGIGPARLARLRDLVTV